MGLAIVDAVVGLPVSVLDETDSACELVTDDCADKSVVNVDAATPVSVATETSVGLAAPADGDA